MDFQTSDRAQEFSERLQAFMDERVLPAEPVWQEQVRESAARGEPHCHPAVMEELKEEARSRGLWNLFLPDPDHGPGLTNLEYAPLAEIMGRTRIASEACNCSAPDTGNMEVLHQFGTPEQQEQWLEPLLAGEIRSGFGMTEPDVASSDATNISMRIERDGDDYVLNGRKWWTTGALHPNARILIVMGKTDPDAHAYQQQSMVLVPLDTPGVDGPAQPAGVRLPRPGGPRRAAVRGRAGAGHQPPSRRGSGLHDRPGPAGPGPDPSLHAQRSAPPSARWSCCATALTRA